MAWTIGWPDVTKSKRLQDNDVVTATIAGGTPGQASIALQLAPHLAWWKSIVVRDNSGKVMNEIWVQDTKKVAAPMKFDSDDIDVGATIELWKAKQFGVHTLMYVLPDLTPVEGKTVTFRWSAD
jgi:hypothetical protein